MPPPSPPFRTFDYLHFAKLHLGDPTYNLGLSGVTQAAPEEFLADGEGAPPELLRWTEWQPAHDRWRAALSSRYGVPAEHCFPALGASGGVFLAIAACHTLVPAGATVAIESPAYGAFDVVARLLGREVVALPRPAQSAYALDPEALAQTLESGARIVCLTDLHNPSGIVLDPDALAAAHELARRHDAWIVLDEVYRDFLPGDVGTGYVPGGRIVCLSSLTKVYGVSGPRLGWLFADPRVLERAESVVEITHGVDPVSSIWIGALALERADRLRVRGRRFARRGRPVMDAWIDATPGVSWTPPTAGITGLVRVEGLTDSMRFARRLREELDVQVVPGAFFGAEGHLRISFGQAPAPLSKALEMLALGFGPLVD